MLLSTAVRVTRPVPVVAPAAIRSIVFALSVKSMASAGKTGVTATVRVTAWADSPERVAVTVATPPFSAMVMGLRVRVAVGVASSSVRVRVAPVTAPAPWALVRVAVTVAVR